MLEKTSSTSTFDMLREITAEQTAREKLLQWRYPWFNVVYNYLMALILIALSVSLYGWALDIWAQRRADQQSAAAVATYQAEQQAIADAQARELAAAQASEAAIIDREATDLAKAFYGIRNFIEKYRYDASDLDTYARCVFNRVDAGNGVNSLDVIIGRKNQFLGYDAKNPVLKEYYTIAAELVETWHRETVKPCDLSYQWAELQEDGIYLINEFNADGYARRWHA